MKIKSSQDISTKSANKISSQPLITQTLDLIQESELRRIVELISIPRHYISEHDNNRKIAAWLEKEFQSYGFHTLFQGAWDNLIALPKNSTRELIAVGAHYDSVPRTPGADDNASAIAAMLCCAKALSQVAPRAPVCFIAFNREEEGLIGSSDFALKFLPRSDLKITKVHILEMLGYCSNKPNSQYVPWELPIKMPDRADFIGVISNSSSNKLANNLLRLAKIYTNDLPVVNLQIYLGLEKLFPVLFRSDHAPFWDIKIPALLWTDTAELRNPNYHLPSDTPETLDYRFMRRITQLLLAEILTTMVVE